jgi:hypothetical protein
MLSFSLLLKIEHSSFSAAAFGFRFRLELRSDLVISFHQGVFLPLIFIGFHQGVFLPLLSQTSKHHLQLSLSAFLLNDKP